MNEILWCKSCENFAKHILWIFPWQKKRLRTKKWDWWINQSVQNIAKNMQIKNLWRQNFNQCFCHVMYSIKITYIWIFEMVMWYVYISYYSTCDIYLRFFDLIISLFICFTSIDTRPNIIFISKKTCKRATHENQYIFNHDEI